MSLIGDIRAMKAPLPNNENERLAALRKYHILDTAPEQAFDDITKLAAFICQTPIATVTLVDEHRQWFKSQVGLMASETPRDLAFCAYTILQSEMLIVEDATRDERFRDNPLVLGNPGIRFYAGAPLQTSDGFGLGSVCVIDHKPRHISQEQTDALTRLARMVMLQFEYRAASARLAEALKNVKTLSGLLPICSYCKQVRNDSGYWQQVEVYIQSHSDATFTHGICAKCRDEQMAVFMASMDGVDNKTSK